MNEELIGYFGFGSLVNRNTLQTDFLGTRPARLKGWRRHWQARSKIIDPNIALLSIHRDTECSILGLLVIDKKSNLPALDERETGYERHQIHPGDIELLGPVTSERDDVGSPELNYVYVAKNPDPDMVCDALLQSYCDAVMQGFRNEFGAAGIENFIETTAGFQREIVLDRGKPIYPRAVDLVEDEMRLFDATLKAAGVTGFSG